MAKLDFSDDRVRLGVLLIVLVVVLAVAGVNLWKRGSVSGAASRSGRLEYEARNLPPLEMSSLGQASDASPESSGNPFTFRPPPTPTRNLTPPPTPTPRAPRAARPTPTPDIWLNAQGTPVPPPPPFNREFIGFFGPRPHKVAAFRKTGDEPGTVEIDVAEVGEVLDDIYIVREIGLESVMIGFVGYAPSEDQRVPLSEQ
jgi:hypothetical protein